MKIRCENCKKNGAKFRVGVISIKGYEGMLSCRPCLACVAEIQMRKEVFGECRDSVVVSLIGPQMRIGDRTL